MMILGQLRTSRGRVVGYSHGHALSPFQTSAASLTSPAHQGHQVVRPSVGEEGVPELVRVRVWEAHRRW